MTRERATSAGEAHDRTDGTGPPRDWASLREDLEADVRRVSERVRDLSQARLGSPVGSHPSRAHAVRRVAQQLAEVAQGMAAREDSTEPDWRALPELSDLSVGDQVTVVGRDLQVEMAGCDPEAAVWVRGSRCPAHAVVGGVSEALAATRRLL